MSRRTLKFITSNKNKLREVQSLIGQNYNIVDVDLELDECQGEPSEILTKKLKEAINKTDGTSPLIVEDTCLCFNALGGLPGPYIKHFLKKLKPEGLYQLLEGFQDKSGYALCTFGYTEGRNKPIHIFLGRVDGMIVSPRGESTFGWDPCFQPSGSTLTFAEMTPEEKNKISHRRRALEKMREYFDGFKDEDSNIA